MFRILKLVTLLSGMLFISLAILKISGMYRGNQFEPYFVRICVGDDCNTSAIDYRDGYVDLIDKRIFDPWPNTNYCRVAGDILAGAGTARDKRFLLASLQNLGVIQIEVEDGSAKVSPGEHIDDWYDPLINQLRSYSAARSCYAGSAAPYLQYLFLFFMLCANLLLYLASRNKRNQ